VSEKGLKIMDFRSVFSFGFYLIPNFTYVYVT